MKFGYVILHYQNIEITKKCIAKLRNNFSYSRIVIVDNCSPNGSGRRLLEEYIDDDLITVLLNDKNDGFAKGNNLGYAYLRDNYTLDIIVVMNNDIMIEDKKFESIIANFMVKNAVDVCGPDIITLKGNHQNPLAYEVYTNAFLRKRIVIDRIKRFLFKNSIFYWIYSQYKKSKSVVIKEKQKQTFNCILHGSCIIFGNRYISNECIAFLPITYMYNEEAILFDYLKHIGYKTGYCDAITILHMEGVSTKTCLKDNKDKVIFRFKHNTDSLAAQLKERQKYENK